VLKQWCACAQLRLDEVDEWAVFFVHRFLLLLLLLLLRKLGVTDGLGEIGGWVDPCWLACATVLCCVDVDVECRGRPIRCEEGCLVH
jgi:hypothetical protein